MTKSTHTLAYRAMLKRLRAARKAKGVTQLVLAQTLGHHQSWVSKVERGERRIDPVELKEIADALGVGIVEMLDAK